MTHLGVNIDHIATLRQARMGVEPDPVYAAQIAEQNGADQITVHLREDRRHIQLRDVKLLREVVQTRLNLEMAPTEEMIAIAKSLQPDTVTLVPEKREELTTEGGLDLSNLQSQMAAIRDAGIELSVFIEPEPDQVKLAGRFGADAVEIHTGRYANLHRRDEIDAELRRLEKAGKMIRSGGMRAVAGHGLNYHNITALAALGIYVEFNIGHSIISRAVFSGLAEAVSTMKRLIGG
ncbi:MAG: pyridoxine 5'-phosphate synthase [Candidatus Cloacimonetes bacterium]|nr:pyridoxine 5'-phosphate synthase [Candidatus Cloacimonadota bacterium]